MAIPTQHPAATTLPPPAPRNTRGRLSSTTAPRRVPFGPGGVLWENTGLVTFSLTNASAFALQTMHPAIGAVVGEHSVFRTDAVGRAKRSIASVLTWVYGGEEALTEADRLRRMHAPLSSTDADGTTHHALSSGPWAWVILSAPFSAVTAARYFSRKRYTPAECERMYQEFVQLMRNLHVQEKQIPSTYEDYLVEFDRIIDEVLVAHPTAYAFLETNKHLPPPPGTASALRPLWRLALHYPGKVQYFVTVGTLPPKARDKLGLRWTERDERLLLALGAVVSVVVELLPERLRYFPIAYQARTVARERATLSAMLEHRPM